VQRDNQDKEIQDPSIQPVVATPLTEMENGEINVDTSLEQDFRHDARSN